VIVVVLPPELELDEPEPEELDELLEDEELDELLEDDELEELDELELELDDELLDEELDELLLEDDELEPLGIEHSLIPPGTIVPAPKVTSPQIKLPFSSLKVN
jgi:hypothetical protein